MKNLNVEQLKSQRENALKPYYEIQDNRMERYFNCQDDTILGGISDQVTSETINGINRKYDLLIKQVQNGGHLNTTCEKLCLFDLDGKFLTDNIIHSKFGYAFCFEYKGETKFVSLAKKQDTFIKKGFQTFLRTRNYKYNFNGVTTKNGHFLYENIELLSETLVLSVENVISNNWVDYLYNSSSK